MAVRKTLIDGFTVEYDDKKQSLKDIFKKEAPASGQVTVLSKDGKVQVKKVEDLSEVPDEQIEACYSNVSPMEKGVNHE